MIKFPSELEIVMTRDFHAPLPLVFDVLTKPEHVRATFAPFGERVTVCDIDLRVGGDYRQVMVTDDGRECAFSGTILELEPPNRFVQTWRFNGWPGVEAVETHELRDAGGITKYTWKLAFRDAAGRAHMSKLDGPEANLDNVEAYLRALIT